MAENKKGVAVQAAFLAGYAAASVTRTGKVGTFGSTDIPPVTDFMDGFALGVQYYNKVNGTEVEVLGWDLQKHEVSSLAASAARPREERSHSNYCIRAQM